MCRFYSMANHLFGAIYSMAFILCLLTIVAGIFATLINLLFGLDPFGLTKISDVKIAEIIFLSFIGVLVGMSIMPMVFRYKEDIGKKRG
ncbi:MAG: hypothetical protein U9N30_04320, partial [Campylobacterota bacterium]|nr:hypothetical protein [Campylobacterota bacterium]